MAELRFIPALIFIASISSFFYCCDNGQMERKVSDIEWKEGRKVSARTELIDSNLYYSGKSIFKTDCNKCHVGKGRLHNFLEGVVDRVGRNYLILYLTKQDSLITAKDSYALELKKNWSQMGNSHNFIYSEHQLNALIEYLK
jgi:hypothetical protein